MHDMKLFALVFVSFFGITVSAQTIDTEKSIVTFEVDNMWLNTVEGTFSNMSGTVRYSMKNPSSGSFSVCVDAATVNTGNKKRDEHLRTEDFFDVAKHPTICIQSKSISSSPEGLRFAGTLTLLGVTKEISFPFTFSDNTLKGTFQINRSDYGLGNDTGTFAVGEEVEITIECVLK